MQVGPYSFNDPVTFAAADRSLLQDCQFFPDGHFTEFEVTRPFALYTTRPTEPRDLAGVRPKVRQQIIKMSVLLKVITPPVRNDSRIDHMQLTNAPRIESRFGE